MRALLAAVGTRGDVQPAVALALELRKRGHEVRMCISPNFVDLAKGLGLDARPMGVEMRAPARGGRPRADPVRRRPGSLAARNGPERMRDHGAPTLPKPPLTASFPRAGNHMPH